MTGGFVVAQSGKSDLAAPCRGIGYVNREAVESVSLLGFDARKQAIRFGQFTCVDGFLRIGFQGCDLGSFGALASALPFIRDGKLLALAVSSPKRTSSLPDVPTTLEAGYPNSDYTFWVAVFAPAKTPKGIVEKLYQKTLKTLQSTNLTDKIATLGVEPMVLTPTELDALVKREIAANADVVKAANIKID
jgi:hypothetical protein